MNSKLRRVENRQKRHQERQQLAREYEKILTGDGEEYLPKMEKKKHHEKVHTT